MLKLMGAGMIVGGFWAVGLLKCRWIRQEQNAFCQLRIALDWMICKLEFQLPPLVELLENASKQSSGSIRRVLADAAQNMNEKGFPPNEALHHALEKETKLSPNVKQQLLLLGQSLGAFDLRGQIEEIQSAKLRCEKALEESIRQHEKRMGSYQTLSLCAGIALVILLL